MTGNLVAPYLLITKEFIMTKNELIQLIDGISKLDKDQLDVVVACAKFQKHLRDRLGEKIDLSTIAAFASLVAALIDSTDD